MRTRGFLSLVMHRAWMLVKVYGFTMSEAMKQSWAVAKLHKAMKGGIVKFFYQKLDGTIRTAWGTLKVDLIPTSTGENNRKRNESVMTYFDQEKAEYRCFKIANFLRIA